VIFIARRYFIMQHVKSMLVHCCAISKQRYYINVRSKAGSYAGLVYRR